MLESNFVLFFQSTKRQTRPRKQTNNKPNLATYSDSSSEESDEEVSLKKIDIEMNFVYTRFIC